VFCDGCEKIVVSKKSSPPDSQSDTLDHPIGVTEKLMECYESIEKSLEKRDLSEVLQTDTRVKHLEEKLSAVDNKLECTHASLKEPKPIMLAMEKDHIKFICIYRTK